LNIADAKQHYKLIKRLFIKSDVVKFRAFYQRLRMQLLSPSAQRGFKLFTFQVNMALPHSHEDMHA
jgi:hypothetical protein